MNICYTGYRRNFNDNHLTKSTNDDVFNVAYNVNKVTLIYQIKVKNNMIIDITVLVSV
ncbi:hypothetical protein IRP63_15800 (plasmid) [Clostridium botulinum]|uniref:hypothetical protein n=1 Tax=Clostridium botulinum TaxID=1491 RepID=UPI000AC255B9|nr:hypothetical protein [Clostridium botulinum]MCD3235392.1 hypothetical protein [Clostridium botulinum D/C]MCD3241315.1 hypothetical protein [Clostridium botulinum D/C]MCD3268800.1 hypothetical protein [Clostridium botulinum D/C]MCD3301024.1 hypothetical protein [Clostridium botulinum D/C]MCD3307081.1 hypothetical protein [Clostridium botulinum D/C]